MCILETLYTRVIIYEHVIYSTWVYQAELHVHSSTCVLDVVQCRVADMEAVKAEICIRVITYEALYLQVNESHGNQLSREEI